MVGTDETFSLTGAIDTTGIRAQMEGIEAQFGEDKDDLSKISLSGTSSSFTACVTFPDQVTLPTNMDQVTVGGLGDLYTVTDKHVEGQNLYITFGLKGDYQNYQQLRDAVFATGVPGVGAGTWITLTVGDLSLKADEVTNNQQLTVTGNVKGSFDSVARGSSGRTEHFQFDWTAKQVKEGRDAFATSDDAIQQTLLVDKPEQRELPGDVKDDAPKVPAVPAAAPKAPAATPNTGDSTNYAPLSMLGALGLVAVVAAAVVRRRWRDER
jgi:hypothetical protein